MLNQQGSGGAVNDAPPLDFVEFLAGERQLAREAAERLLGSELRLFYTPPPESSRGRSTFSGMRMGFEQEDEKTVRGDNCWF